MPGPDPGIGSAGQVAERRSQDVRRGAFEPVSRLVMALEQRNEFCVKRRVALFELGEEHGPLAGRQVARMFEQLAELLALGCLQSVALHHPNPVRRAVARGAGLDRASSLGPAQK